IETRLRGTYHWAESAMSFSKRSSSLLLLLSWAGKITGAARVLRRRMCLSERRVMKGKAIGAGWALGKAKLALVPSLCFLDGRLGFRGGHAGLGHVLFQVLGLLLQLGFLFLLGLHLLEQGRLAGVQKVLALLLGGA